MASALDAELVLMRVLEAQPSGDRPPDPVEWDLRQREAIARVNRLAREHALEADNVRAKVVAGRASDQICICERQLRADLVVLCTSGDGGTNGRNLGSTARMVINCARSSVLLVPSGQQGNLPARYRRILVPLDGSSRAESALPTAIRVAAAHDAELIVFHAVPAPELTEIGPIESSGLDLRIRLMERNADVAQSYLDHIRARIADKGLSVKIVLMRDDDVRHQLGRAVTDLGADLVVMASHGHGGYGDVAIGTVAGYMAEHTPVPLLIVRKGASGCTALRGDLADRAHGCRTPLAAQ